jgi:DNA-binding transcriptional LysR family regulator
LDEHFPGRRAFFERACGTAGFVPVDVTETDSVPLLLAAVAMGAGAGILPSHAKKLPHKACVFIPFTSPVLVSTLFLLSQNKETSPEAQALAASLKTCPARLGREGLR